MADMLALSILQPYAWLIVHGHKDIENRGWYTRFRGDFLVHTGKKYSKADHEFDQDWLLTEHGIHLPALEDIPRGGICGQARIVACVKEHTSVWKDEGSWGFVVADAKPCAFIPWKGQLGFFAGAPLPAP